MERLGFSQGKKSSMRETIISILGIEFPLTARKIYNILRKRGFEVTYQAAHKTLKAMLEDDVLEKNIKEYRINKNWINKIKNFSERLENRYSDSYMHLPGYEEFNKKQGMKTFVFNSLLEAENYRKKLQKEYIMQDCQKPPYCGQSNHLKSPLIYSEKSIDILKIISKTGTKCFLIVGGNSDLDKWCANYYDNEYVRVKTGTALKDDCELMVLGDIIIQTYIPSDILNDIDRMYETSKTVSEINVPVFYSKIYEKQTEIKMIILNNPEMAKRVRNDAIDYFEKGIAVFDVDGTLVDGFLMRDFSRFLERNDFFEKKNLEKIDEALKKYNSEKIGYEIASNVIINNFAAGLKNRKLIDIDNLARLFSEKCDNKLHKHSECILKHMQKKMETIALTASPFITVKYFGKRLKFNNILASEIEVKNGIYTGKISKNLATKKAKSRELRKFAQNRFDLEKSFGFGDTINDVSFLELVAMPVALNPDKELIKIAKDKKWLIYKKEENLNDFLKKIS